MADTKNTETEDDLWLIDNYIVLIDYYDRTISRIAARCVRQGKKLFVPETPEQHLSARPCSYRKLPERWNRYKAIERRKTIRH